MAKKEMPDRIKQAVAGVLELFNSPDLPKAIARATFPKVGKPLSAWSFSNKLICAVDWIIHKYPSEYKKLKTPKARGEFLGKHIFHALDEADYRGFNQWKEKSRFINKGSKASYILAPMFGKGSSKFKMVDGKKVRVSGDEAKGKDIQTEEFKYIRGFTGIAVFNKDNTNGKEIVYKELKLPQLPYMPVATFLGLKVIPKAFTGRAYGSYSPNYKVITLATPDQAVFFHELAHAVDDYLMIQKTGKGLKGGQQKDQEIVADFTASVLAYMIGYNVKETIAETKNYVTHYAGDQDPEASVIQLLSRIEKIIDFITNFKEAKSPTRQMEEKTGEPKSEVEELADNPPKAKGVDVDGVGKTGAIVGTSHGRKVTIVESKHKTLNSKSYDPKIGDLVHTPKGSGKVVEIDDEIYKVNGLTTRQGFFYFDKKDLSFNDGKGAL